MDKKFKDLWKIKTNEILMMRDRGFAIDNLLEHYDEKYFSNLSNTVIYDKARDGLSYIYIKADQKIKVKYFPYKETSVTDGDIKSYISNEQNSENMDYIIIANTAIKTNVLFNIKNINAVAFTDNEMKRRIVDHFFVDKHEKLTQEEKEDLLASGITLDQLPKLTHTPNSKEYKLLPIEDPLIKHYGWRKGDIIRIRRHDISLNSLVEKQIYYRVVFFGL